MAISANLGRDTDHNSTKLVCAHPLRWAVHRVQKSILHIVTSQYKYLKILFQESDPPHEIVLYWFLSIDPVGAGGFFVSVRPKLKKVTQKFLVPIRYLFPKGISSEGDQPLNIFELFIGAGT